MMPEEDHYYNVVGNCRAREERINQFKRKVMKIVVGGLRCSVSMIIKNRLRLPRIKYDGNNMEVGYIYIYRTAARRTFGNRNFVTIYPFW